MKTGIPSRIRRIPSLAGAAVLIMLAIYPLWADAQLGYPRTHDSLFSTYYHQRYSHFRSMPEVESPVIFLGNSITDGAEWAELFNDPKVLNRGISGDNATGVFHRLPEITRRQPRKVFLLIGINDLARGTSPDSVFMTIRQIAQYIRSKSPRTALYVQSVLPVNEKSGKFPQHAKRSAAILQLNRLLKEGEQTGYYQYVDVYPFFAGADGKLREDLSNDGLHLMAMGYQLWKTLVFPKLYDLSGSPALIPEPQSLQWDSGWVFLSDLRDIRLADSFYYKTALQLQRSLREIGYSYPIVVTGNANINAPGESIRLRGDTEGKLAGEAYVLHANASGIELRAGAAEGLFRAVTTLLQLARDRTAIPYVQIADRPAFAWRGFLVDVGRNYISLPGLKAIIDQMARYKLNVLHFHATEHIAWRMEVPGFPELTQASTQTRHTGSYYSVEEIRELIRYCEERHILFLPEIDMPGHSEAFRRATGYDMQTDSGRAILLRVLDSFLRTYPIRTLHIGADEVKITDAGFLPAIISFLTKRGVKLIGWQPGGNFSGDVTRQLWVGGPGIKPEWKQLPVIDSKHLYINHMDPLESVTTLYMRKILEQDQGDEKRKGATLCLWHDRAIRQESDLWMMDPLYPSMIAFSARVWKGGGPEGWRTGPDLPGQERQLQFDAFEDRLMEHKQLYFRDQPFPYTAQKDIEWTLVGPFENRGDTRSDLVETLFPFAPGSAGTIKARGGTVILRHWWAPLIRGAIPEPRENTTWYAFRRIWSDNTDTAAFWVGTEDMSRSVVTDLPLRGHWDQRGSRIWWNGQELRAPLWKNAGAKPDLELPFTDEGYTYREPLRLPLRQGWNEVLIKLPMAGFRRKGSNYPEKWMFTFVRVGN